MLCLKGNIPKPVFLLWLSAFCEHFYFLFFFLSFCPSVFLRCTRACRSMLCWAQNSEGFLIVSSDSWCRTQLLLETIFSKIWHSVHPDVLLIIYGWAIKRDFCLLSASYQTKLSRLLSPREFQYALKIIFFPRPAH